MNYRVIARVLSLVMFTLAGLLLLPFAAGLWYHESVLNFIITMAAALAVGAILFSFRPKTSKITTKEGYIAVGLAWILMSVVSALPFVISGDIPNYVDALFETVSGYTTTGSSVVTSIETMSRGCAFWRMFTHWIGGMGVLVFIMAVMPKGDEHSMHIMRAEVPGPVVGKLVPKMRDTAMILYIIYAALTVIETILLLLGGMSFYDAVLHAFSTAGTGGFSTHSEGIAYFHSAYIEIVVGVFMMLFGLNFNLYYLVVLGRVKDAVKNEEFRTYVLMLAAATAAIAVGIVPEYGSFGTALRYAFFNVTSISSTTGFTHADFTQWPVYTQTILVLLMFVGGCAGSTGGGLKMSRVMLLAKSSFADFRKIIRPREVVNPTLDGKKVDAAATRAVYAFATLYFTALLLGTLVVSFDGNSFETSFTAALACISNIGPGLSAVGPLGSYAGFSSFTKLFLAALMLLGRLEIYPILILLTPKAWKSNR